MTSARAGMATTAERHAHATDVDLVTARAHRDAHAPALRIGEQHTDLHAFDVAPQLTMPSMSSHEARAPSTISVVTLSTPARPAQCSSSVDSTEPSKRNLPGLGRSSRLAAIIEGTTPAATSSEATWSASALVFAWRNPPVSLISET